MEDSLDMSTAIMQLFILNIIYIGSQIMPICNYWIYLEYDLHWVTNNTDLQLLDNNHAMYFSKMLIFIYGIILITQISLSCMVD